MTFVVYAIRHITSGRCYVGSTRNCRNRWKSHRSELQRGFHYCDALQTAWTEYGAAAFEFIRLETVEDDRFASEAAWMTRLGNVYNTMLPLPENPAVIGAMPETRAKQRAAKLGKPQPPGLMAALHAGNRGSKRTAEQRERISEGLRGRVQDESAAVKRWETRRAKFGASGGPPMTDEQRKARGQAISAALQAKKRGKD